MKRFENIEIKNVITLVALLLGVGHSAYGCYLGQFDTVFDFFKECFLMVISFYLGTKTKQQEEVEIEKPVETIVQVPVQSETEDLSEINIDN